MARWKSFEHGLRIELEPKGLRSRWVVLPGTMIPALGKEQTIRALSQSIRTSRWEMPLALVLAVVLAPPLIVAPALTLVGIVAVTLGALVVLHPPAAVYLLLLSTPLVAGIERGAFLPVLRVNEALILLVGGALLLRALIRLTSGEHVSLRPTKIDGVITVLAVTGSIVPLLWMSVRNRIITADDVQYALALWKYFALYIIFRSSIHTDRQVRRCLSLTLATASVVALIAVLQALELFGVPTLIERWYPPFGDQGLPSSRGTSTLGSAFATGDLMAFHLAIALAWLVGGGQRRGVLRALAVLFVVGGLASGQFSSVLALVVVAGAVGLVTGTLTRVVVGLLPTALAAVLLLQPVIENRLAGFSSGGVPSSWLGRLENLRRFFWPELVSDLNIVLGVRPSARIPAPEPWREYVWIESGHIWLLWNGGLLMLGAFILFVATTIRALARIARQRAGATSIAACAAFASLSAVTVLMTFDPHLTLRGSADLLFSLIGLAFVREQVPGAVSADRPAPLAHVGTLH